MRSRSAEEWQRRLAPKFENPAPHVPGGARISREAVELRWQLLQTEAAAREALLDPQTVAQMKSYERNVEHFIGACSRMYSHTACVANVTMFWPAASPVVNSKFR